MKNYKEQLNYNCVWCGKPNSSLECLHCRQYANKTITNDEPEDLQDAYYDS